MGPVVGLRLRLAASASAVAVVPGTLWVNSLAAAVAVVSWAVEDYVVPSPPQLFVYQVSPVWYAWYPNQARVFQVVPRNFGPRRHFSRTPIPPMLSRFTAHALPSH